MPQFSSGGSCTLSSNHSKLAGHTPKQSNASNVDISSTTFSPSLMATCSSSLTTSRSFCFDLASCLATARARSLPAPLAGAGPPEGMSSSSPSAPSSSPSSATAASIPRMSSAAKPRAREPTASFQSARPRFGGLAVGPGASRRALFAGVSAGEDEAAAVGGRAAGAVSAMLPPAPNPIPKSSGKSSRAATPLTAASTEGSPRRVAKRRKALSANITDKPPLCCDTSLPCLSRMCAARAPRRPGVKVSRNLSIAACSQISANSSGL
mmetsp:Transcript_51289/g.112407  ORF Transcript_51289/g.112407 Transcript_51289/m.112407 type:complete len:266 (+) Transcript_51289:108-905(+)